MLIKKANYFIFNKLSFGRTAITGRNASGSITIRHRGAGHSRVYRIVDFFRYIWDVNALIVANLYDANRTAPLNLKGHSNGVLNYNLATLNTQIASRVMNCNLVLNMENRNNYSAYLKFIRPGVSVHAVEHKPLSKSKFVRAASTFAKLVSNATNYTILKLRSKVLLKISNLCVATIGILTSKNTFKITKKNAGFTRRVGFRPSVRGVAMNPVDHPHGGGQGKTSGGRPSVTP